LPQLLQQSHPTSPQYRAPKSLEQNARFRSELLAACDDPTYGPNLRNDLIVACTDDPVFFIDTFGWTYAVKDSADEPDVPFILWPYQEDSIRRLDAAIGKSELLVEKSRDMGATWIILAAFLHRWLFRRRQSFLLGSRKEDLVDQTGNPGCLFWKIRYMISMLPPWLMPSGDMITDNSMHIENHLTGSVLDGESTNDDFARGDRRTAIMLDEFAAVENGNQILKATRDATNCRIFVSTPQGAVGAFYDTRTKMVRDTPERILRMHWTQHPLKSQGMYIAHKGGKIDLLDRANPVGPDYPCIYDNNIRSPWYDEQCRRAAHPQEIAQELDIDYAASGWQFFSEEAIRPLLARTTAALLRGELTYLDKGEEPRWSAPVGLDGNTRTAATNARIASTGRLQLWIPLDARNEPADGDYVVSADVALGNASSDSSSSVISIGCRRTKRKIGMFSSNAVKPHELAVYAIALCKWFHGAQLIWETNGPGGSFTKVVRECNYRNVFMRDSEDAFDSKKTGHAGWHSGKEKKQVLLQDYARALMDSILENPCREAIEELREYVHAPDGSIVHDKAKKSGDPTASGANHGDMVIADALLWLAMNDRSVAGMVDGVITEYPVNSFGWRRDQWVKKSAEQSYY